MAEGGLGLLYLQILVDASRNNNFELAIGTNMLLRESIPIELLANLLWLQSLDIMQTLQGLQWILVIPDSDNEVIHLVHASLQDFLVSLVRSDNFFSLISQLDTF
jgi:hypothetical protein